MMDKCELKPTEYVDHIIQVGNEVFVNLQLEDGEYTGILHKRQER